MQQNVISFSSEFADKAADNQLVIGMIIKKMKQFHLNLFGDYKVSKFNLQHCIFRPSPAFVAGSFYQVVKCGYKSLLGTILNNSIIFVSVVLWCNLNHASFLRQKLV